jgi:hypothetical protein
MADISAEVVGSNQPVESVSSEAPVSYSFDDAHAKALAMFEGTPEGEQPVEPAPVAEPAEEATNVDNASAAQLAKLDDNQLVEVTVDGEVVQMPWKDARGGVMRQAKFTKEMQNLRSQQQEFETSRAQLLQAQQEREQLVNLLKSEDMMKEFLQKAYPNLVQQAQAAAAQATGVDPDDIATVGQLQQLQQAAAQNVQQMMEQFQQQLGEQLETVTQTIEDRQVTAKLSNDINATISEIFHTHPELSTVIPNADQMLRYEVLRLAPSTPEETIQAFKQVAEGWVENLNKTVEKRTKQSVIQKQKLVGNNIQPPGGASVQPQPTSFKKVNPMTGKTEVDWKALNSVAMGLLDKK